jgi:endonuclease III related protein
MANQIEPRYLGCYCEGVASTSIRRAVVGQASRLPRRRLAPVARAAPRAAGGTPAPLPALRRAYVLMRARFGHQHWWPGETPFEVCVGAILTQNTSWRNVERAIANLKAAGVLRPEKLFALEESKLAALIRPAGYFNVKARRLRAFLRVLVEEYGGSLKRLFAGETSDVRERLLAIHGIGPETADSMLLYAGGHHRFVIDSYTKRIFQRHGWSRGDAGYEELQRLCESALNHKPLHSRLDYWQDYHAQLVAIGNNCCRTHQPRCAECPLEPLLPQGRQDEKAAECRRASQMPR